MKPLSLALAAALALAACNKDAPPAPSSSEEIVFMPSSQASSAIAARRELVGERDAPKVLGTFSSRVTDAKSWFTPAAAEVDAMEQRLPGFLQNAGKAPLASDVIGYFRHVFGFVDDKGGRHLFAVYACRGATTSTNKDLWRREARIPKGGGADCSFDVDYAIASGTFQNLNVHPAE